MNNIFENDKIRAAYSIVLESEEVKQSQPQHKLTKEHENNPAVWIGTYGNYNDGNLYGVGEASGWIDLTTFDDADEFHDWLNEQSGGRDVEWMFQDYQNFPSSLYSESNIDNVWDYIDFKEENSWISDEVLDAVLEDYSFEEAVKKFDDGDIVVYPDCKSMGDVAQHLISEHGNEIFNDSTYENAFDYEQYGKESSWDWSESDNDGQTIYTAYGVDEDDDESLGIAIVDSFGGLEELGKETIMRYVDFDTIGRDLEIDGNWIHCGDSMVEIS